MRALAGAGDCFTCSSAFQFNLVLFGLLGVLLVWCGVRVWKRERDRRRAMGAEKEVVRVTRSGEWEW